MARIEGTHDYYMNYYDSILYYYKMRIICTVAMMHCHRLLIPPVA